LTLRLKISGEAKRYLHSLGTKLSYYRTLLLISVFYLQLQLGKWGLPLQGTCLKKCGLPASIR
jgi:hypothetical protein